MSDALDACSDQRAARWVVRVGLWAGAACLLVGAAVYLETAPDAAPAAWADGTGATPQEEEAPAASLARLKHPVPAAFAVLGTMLLSVGAVFALLGRLGVLAARRDVPSPELRNGDSAPVRNGSGEAVASPDRGARPRGPHDRAPRSIPPRGSAPAAPANPAIAPAHGEAAGVAAAGGAGPYGTRATGPGSDEAGWNTSTDGAGPTPHDATVPAFGDRAGPGPGVQSPRPHASADEAGTPSVPADEPPPPEPPQPGDLIDAWDEYRRNGDGHFSPRGLQESLDQWELGALVSHGDRVGAGGAVLVVETPGTPNFHVLPSFNKSPRAVADWFDDASSGALTGRTQHVVRVAQGRWSESGTGGFEAIEKGEVR